MARRPSAETHERSRDLQHRQHAVALVRKGTGEGTHHAARWRPRRTQAYLDSTTRRARSYFLPASDERGDGQEEGFENTAKARLGSPSPSGCSGGTDMMRTAGPESSFLSCLFELLEGA